MVHEEILTGLKNAIERGQPVEKAVQSMISAGYKPEEVNEAVNSINLGSIGEISKQEIRQTLNIPDKPAQETQPAYKPLPTEHIPAIPTVQSTTPKRKIPHWLILLLIFVGALILFIVLFSLFGEKILSALFK